MIRPFTTLAILTLTLVACDGRGTTRRSADAANASDADRGSESGMGNTGTGAVGTGTETGMGGTGSAGNATVRSIELGKSVNPSMRVTNATTQFTPSDTMYLAVIVANPQSDSRLTARWTMEDGSVIDSSGQSVARDNGTSSSVTQFKVMHDDRSWPVGKYTVDVWMNGVLAGTKMFTVARQ